ncbi:acyl-CoA dehydrogenase family protein [Nocardia nova]|uniref:Acyl-CoA dehydrogenase n=1 Tax=Nocardia nova TaxID=37330 RepID=A0A2S5ZZA3_9NOCA|nr:acyl-CoA dehydrogenase family protein [Nocardia nova]PPI91265.1 acyl-CoA dehydrogenase [Nocardia nova]PPJ23826.1 acyl-CoA dehydrogenase [Nocardia nova]
MNSTQPIDHELVAMFDSVFAAHPNRHTVPGACVEFDRDLWKVLDELGLTRLTGSESHGGSGADWYAASALLGAAAAAAVPNPVAEHDMLAGWLLETAGLPMTPGLRTACAISDSGSSAAVPWARHAEFVVALRHDGTNWVVADVPATSVDVRCGQNLANEPRDGVTIGIDAVTWSPVPSGTAETMLLRGALARVLQSCGAMERIADLCLAHVSSREQFGRSLAKFQAVQRLVSAIAAEAALARAAADAAVAHVERKGWDDDRTAFVVAVAKSCAGHASSTVVRNAHQIHGAIGTTFEHDLHRYTNPVLAWRADFGSVARWDRLLTDTVVDTGPDAAWALVTDGGAVRDLLRAIWPLSGARTHLREI